MQKKLWNKAKSNFLGFIFFRNLLDTNLIYLFAGCIFLSIFIKIILNAWITEDAYICYRVIDNFVNGFGLRWNIDERVQVFTNPLWTLIHIPFYYFTRETYFTSLAICIIFSGRAVLFLIQKYYKEPLILLLSIFLPIIFSRPFMDFATSGLENPLVFFFIGLYSLYFMEEDKKKRKICWKRLPIIASLCCITRLDTIFLFIPSLIVTYIKKDNKLRFSNILKDYWPIIIWIAFSLIYYGFIFPNTKYAKINTGIPFLSAIYQGLTYAKDLIMYHTSTALIITVAIIIFVRLAFIISLNAMTEMNFRIFALGVGLILYIIYIISVGGDFMSGRFWTYPFFLSVIIIAEYLKNTPLEERKIKYGFFLFSLILCLSTRFIIKDDLILLPAPMAIRSTGIADEKLFYRNHNTLDKVIENGYTNTHPWLDIGKRHWRNSIINKRSGIKYVTIAHTIGMIGFTSGPDVIIIDRLALSDPILARLPIESTEKARIGHFERSVPEGYIYARETGSLEKMEKNIAEYYKAIRIITSDNLFNFKRILTIIKFNFGYYDYYLKNYLIKTKAKFA